MAANKPGKEAILAAFFDEGNYSPLFTDGAVSAAFGCANGAADAAVKAADVRAAAAQALDMLATQRTTRLPKKHGNITL